ncbi:hypothetical protein XENOCAPTIV_019817 [Xenoophorus captivus]|uniref:Uncharacterized protein n=1 Tax=Xenoophorus captivus TaxID=1517983 RepID=A0ABV0QVZ4_9TELE
MRFVDKIAKSKYFQKATETEFIKKKMEEVSNTPILLTVEVQECKGTLAVNIPPPPTDRIWYGFRSPPHLELKARPKLGEREVTLVHVTEWIEKKLDQEFQIGVLAYEAESAFEIIKHSSFMSHLVSRIGRNVCTAAAAAGSIKHLNHLSLWQPEPSFLCSDQPARTTQLVCRGLRPESNMDWPGSKQALLCCILALLSCAGPQQKTDQQMVGEVFVCETKRAECPYGLPAHYSAVCAKVEELLSHCPWLDSFQKAKPTLQDLLDGRNVALTLQGFCSASTVALPESLLFVSTLDGNLHAVSKKSGSIKWTLKEGSACSGIALDKE